MEDTVGFLSIVGDQAQGWRGGYLVTDFRGNPLRFCLTRENVIVTGLQKVLLGKGLERHVCCDRVARALLEEDGQRVSAVLCDREVLLGLRRLTDLPLGIWREGKLLAHEERSGDQEVLDRIQPALDLVDGPLEVFERVAAALRSSQECEAAEPAGLRSSPGEPESGT